MKDILQSEPAGQSEPVESPTAKNPPPQGIGMAVAFDWGLTVQLLAGPLLPLVLRNLSGSGFVQLPTSMLKLSPVPAAVVTFLISLPFAAGIAIFGEGIRRGWRWTRPVQIVFNTLLVLLGLFTFKDAWEGSKVGNFWPAYSSVLLLVVSPLIAWRLSRPATARWFKTVTSDEARKRHGGLWPWLILLWGLIGGLLQALAAAH
jgi:hypothetical protein